MKQITILSETQRTAAIDYVADILKDDKMKAVYYSQNGEQYICFFGWLADAGMSPANHLAMVTTLGEQVAKEIEDEAAARVAAAAKQLAESAYTRHALEADQNGNAIPTEGAFVWAVTSGLKGDGGVPGEIRANIDGEDNHRELCKVEHVITIPGGLADFGTPRHADLCVESLRNQYDRLGGTQSDDVEDGRGWSSLSEVERKTFYTLVFAVVDPDSGAWYLVDAEGYDYARYILLPTDWRERLAPVVAQEQKRIEDEEQAREDEQKAARLARLQDYEARAAKWSPIMVDVRPLVDASSAAWKALDAVSYKYSVRKKSPEYKAYRSAEARLNAARRKNIATMFQAVCPGVKCSVKRCNGWGADWELTYYDGPTEETLKAATDFALFCKSYDTFDGYTDMADVARMEFTQFADKYMAMTGGEVKVTREKSDEKRAEISAKIDTCTDADHVASEQREVWTGDELHRIADAFGVNVTKLTGCNEAGTKEYRATLIHRIWVGTDYMTPAPVSPTPDTQEGEQTTQADTTAQTGTTAPTVEKSQTVKDEEAAPHISLSLISIAGDGVAVIGSQRATYCNRKAIKAHGCTWNREAGRWQVTSPDDVARVKAWFALRAS